MAFILCSRSLLHGILAWFLSEVSSIRKIYAPACNHYIISDPPICSFLQRTNLWWGKAAPEVIQFNSICTKQLSRQAQLFRSYTTIRWALSRFTVRRFRWMVRIFWYRICLNSGYNSWMYRYVLGLFIQGVWVQHPNLEQLLVWYSKSCWHQNSNFIHFITLFFQYQKYHQLLLLITVFY